MRRRVALACTALAVWVAGAALGTASAPHAQALPQFAIGLAHPAQAFPSLSGKKPIFILALGSDARPGEPIARERSDSIHIIGLNPAKQRASILGFPRDSWVHIPGAGTNKINSAMSSGGPQLTIKTIESLTGIHIDFFVLTSFGGLSSMINAVGGVTVDVPYPMHDHFSGADFSPGVQHLNGKQALSFARDRHDTPGGDLGRSENQGRLFLAALQEFTKDFRKDPSVLLDWIGAGMRASITDMPLPEVLKLGFTAAQVPASAVKNVVVPAVGGTEGTKSVVFIQPAAQALYKNMKDDGLLN